MEATISKKRAIIITFLSIILLILVGNLIGYAFFWNQYDTATSVQKNTVSLEEEKKIEPKDIDNQVVLGWNYYLQGDYNQAKEQFSELVKKNKQNFEAQYGLANAYMGLGNYGKAEQILLELKKINTENEEVIHDLGITYREQTKYEKAEEELLEGLRINSSSAGINFDLALVYEKMNNKETAITYYKKTVDLVPTYTDAIESLKRLGVNDYKAKGYH